MGEWRSGPRLINTWSTYKPSSLSMTTEAWLDLGADSGMKQRLGGSERNWCPWLALARRHKTSRGKELLGANG